MCLSKLALATATIVDILNSLLPCSRNSECHFTAGPLYPLFCIHRFNHPWIVSYSVYYLKKIHL